MDQKDLIKVIDFWRENPKSETLFARDLLSKIKLDNPEVVDVIGPRRCGKSSLLKLLIAKLPTDSWVYMNFEDPFFLTNNSAQVIEEIVEVFQTNFSDKLKFLFFDEIQNIANWEKAIRKLRDSGLYKIFITGSSSKLLSRELSSLLSGRHLSFNLLPLSFGEFLVFKNFPIKNKRDLVIKDKMLLKLFDEFLQIGGFPQAVLNKAPELLKQYYSDIVQKDIVNRYEVREKEVLEKMGIFLLSNSGKIVSLSSLKKLYGISFQLAATYVDYFKEGFMVFEVPQFSYSLKTQQKAFKKIYAIDTGLSNAVSFRFSEDRGRLLKNVVALELYRKNEPFFYFKHIYGEVDFLVQKQRGKYDIIQVCSDLSDEKTRKREINGIELALKEVKVNKIFILTDNSMENIKIGEHIVRVMPIFQWAIESNKF